MGCCCSKKEAEEDEKEEEKASKKPQWDPPPPPPEEETVKEVLSETPKTKSKPKPKPKPPPLPSPPVFKPDDNETSNAELEKKPRPKPSEIPPSDDRSEQPQPSDDACSLSEVTSNATSVTTREREKEDISAAPTSSLPRIQRGNGNGNIRKSYSGELVRGGSRRERSSPVVVAGVGCRSGRTSPAPPSRNSRSLNGNANGVKRDVGERSGRRSVSPGAKRREAVLPGGPGEKLGPNRGVPVRRVPALPPNKAAPLSEGGSAAGPEGKESLENPSVSLECFIFL